MLTRFGKLVSLSLAAMPLGACSDAASGSARFTVWGEEYIEQGIPASEFADGWSVQFDKFLIGIGDVSVADQNARIAGRLSGSTLFDLVRPGPHRVGELSDLEARRWEGVGYTVTAVARDTELGPSVLSADLELMRAHAYAVYASGTAVRGEEVKTFAWGFSGSTRYEDCVQLLDGREVLGLAIPDGGVESVELTIHGDHLFYDDLASPEAVLRFDPFAAADADDDGAVALEELATIKLVSIGVGTYGTGSSAHVDDLAAFVRALVSSLGHFRGEGHCAARAL